MSETLSSSLNYWGSVDATDIIDAPTTNSQGKSEFF